MRNVGDVITFEGAVPDVYAPSMISPPPPPPPPTPSLNLPVELRQRCSCIGATAGDADGCGHENGAGICVGCTEAAVEACADAEHTG